jgi:hypothetical protein
MEQMNEFSLAAVNHAIEQSSLMEFPPNLGQFVKHCRDYVPPADDTLRLTRKFTDDEKARNKQRVQELMKQFVSNREIAE